MRNKRNKLTSYRLRREKLERNFQLKMQVLIVLTRILSFLTLILSCYLERF